MPDTNRSRLPIAALSFGWFFCVLAAYYCVRPVRETMATVVGSQWIDELFLAVFLIMLAATPVYGFAVARISRRWLVPLVYRFFSVWLIGFYWLMRSGEQPSFAVGCTFYVWVSVFNLFVVSVFWSVMADIYTSEEGKRLFGAIAAGGSLGGLVSSAVITQYAETIGVANLLLIPIVVLEVGLVFAWLVNRHSAPVTSSTRSRPDALDEGTGGGMLEGFFSVLRSPYLLGICLFLLLGKFCATAVYVRLIQEVELHVSEPAVRARLFALENLTVQAITMVFQLVLTAQFMRQYGLAMTLGMLPVLMIVGFAAVVCQPTLLVILYLQVMQRSLAYGVVNPAREVLFTVVSREQKYKSKGFLDTAVFRGGDSLSSRVYAASTQVASATTVTAVIMIPAALLWTVLAVLLGREQARLAQQLPATGSSMDSAGAA